MATTDWFLSDTAGLEADAAESLADGTADLKALLYSIVDQLSDADRRHTDTMQQMQDRLAAMSREANSMRDRVPEAFGPAFERIECGMNELAERIAESCSVRDVAPTSEMAVAPAQTELEADAAFAQAVSPPPSPAAIQKDAPLALRSAAGQTPSRNRDAHVDNFDVIESTPTGSDQENWERDAVDALAGFYDKSASALPMPASSAPPSDAGALIPDHKWLEERFAAISERIEESLADIRPDDAFFALGQRLETVEHNVARVADTVATHADVEGIRLIETHISDFASHLDAAHAQLMRLDVIESHLSDISSRLADVHQVALASEAPAAVESAMSIDEAGILAVARIAVEEVKQSFASLAPKAELPAADDLRFLIQRMMSESRAGEENTIALLDTLQQAMIRLLDRVDAMEMAQQQAISAQVVQQPAITAPWPQVDPAKARNKLMHWDDELQSGPHFTFGAQNASATALEEAVAAVAGAKAPHPFESTATVANVYGGAPDAPYSEVRTPDQIRQEFIADARRAKMRLAKESVSSEASVATPDSPVTAEAQRQGAKSTSPRGKSAPKSGTPAARAAAKPTSAPRLLVMALASLTLLGGLWYALDSGVKVPFDFKKPTVTRSGDRPAGAELTDQSTNNNPAKGAAADDGAAPPDAGKGLEADPAEGPRGEIVPDNVLVGQTSVPLMGIAVDAEAPVTADELERARRRQAMAAMSSKLGHAAAKMTAATPTPASLTPEDPNKNANSSAETALLKSGMSTASPLDMPPATVGPLSLRLAAANGDPSAEFDVGARLAEGKGKSPNFKDAAKWYQRSADKGFAQAQYRLGTLYERGLGLKPDPARAMAWYEKAAAAGNVKAMHNLAVMSANQNGSSPDYDTAGKWFSEAAERGLSDSQFNLAVLLENGLGVEKDMKQSYKWLSIAARGGDGEAIRRRDILKGKLTQTDLDAAEDLVKNWRARQVDALINDARTASDAWKKNPQNGISG